MRSGKQSVEMADIDEDKEYKEMMDVLRDQCKDDPEMMEYINSDEHNYRASQIAGEWVTEDLIKLVNDTVKIMIDARKPNPRKLTAQCILNLNAIYQERAKIPPL